MKEHGWSENYNYNTDDFLLYRNVRLLVSVHFIQHPVSESLISL